MNGQAIAISGLDLAIIIIYLVGIVTLGCWAGLRRRSQSKGKDYFLAGGTLTWPIIGLAMFSTNISTIHLVGFAQSGYETGLVKGNFEWMAAFTLIMLSLFFAPLYIRSKVATLPDYLEKRYSSACRNWLAVLSIISAIFIHIGFSLYTGAVVLNGLFGFNTFLSIIVISGLTGLYTIIGGLLAVVLTESIQTIILLVGSITMTLIGYSYVGGWSGMESVFTSPQDRELLTILRSEGENSWYAIFLGYPIIGIWYWCTDQTIVQRVLGAKDENHARIGPLFAGFIKILPTFIFVLPGLICLALVRQGHFTDSIASTKDTFAFMMTHLLPPGLVGLVAAALLAALMSTVSGALNSIATLFSYDLYKVWKPDADDAHLIRVGRIVTFIGMVAAICWSPFLGRYTNIFDGMTVLICYIAPPITTVFIWGVFWRRASSLAAFSTMVGGSIVGFVIFLLDWNKEVTGWSFPFMLASFTLFVLCSIVLVVLSYFIPHKHTAESEALVWKSPRMALQGETWSGLGNYKILSSILFITMVTLYYIFR